MGNLGYQGVENRLAAVNAAHGDAAMRLTEARDRTEGKCARAAFMHSAHRSSLSILNNIVGEMPAFNPDSNITLRGEDQEALRLQLDERVQKVMDIVALLINEGEADISEMEGMIELIRAMDVQFFDFADTPEEAAGKQPRENEKMKRIVYQYYREFMFSRLVGVKIEEE